MWPLNPKASACATRATLAFSLVIALATFKTLGHKLQQRVALGLSYHGGACCGWQSQGFAPDAPDTLERHLQWALANMLSVAPEAVKVFCAGRTDTGVHAAMQVVHLDFDAACHRRGLGAFVSGVNRYLHFYLSALGQVGTPGFSCALQRPCPPLPLFFDAGGACRHGRTSLLPPPCTPWMQQRCSRRWMRLLAGRIFHRSGSSHVRRPTQSVIYRWRRCGSSSGFMSLTWWPMPFCITWCATSSAC